MKHNRKEREPYLSDLLEYVRMPLLTPRYITDVIDIEVSFCQIHAAYMNVKDAAVTKILMFMGSVSPPVFFVLCVLLHDICTFVLSVCICFSH